jgi:hypothetical protein
MEPVVKIMSAVQMDFVVHVVGMV